MLENGFFDTEEDFTTIRLNEEIVIEEEKEERGMVHHEEERECKCDEHCQCSKCRVPCDENCCISKSKEVRFAKCEAKKAITVMVPDGSSCSCTGRLLRVDVDLKKICPNKKVNIGVVLTDAETHEELGFRAAQVTVSHEYDERTVGPFCFVIPECDFTLPPRRVKVNVIFHYKEF
ncbi:MAG: hypothetical protein FWH14_07685 [Oscillospiraceae bacterium]|nr:hypothetical protein [Oscillospiraceae bacterium]